MLKPGRAWLTVAIVAVVALALKVHYSVADAAALRWILAPTTFLVELFTGDTFHFEAGIGYVSRQRHFAIAAPCAGVNFLIIAFCTLGWAMGWLERSWRWALGAALAALATTVFVNATRIWLAMAVRDANWTTEWWTSERVHRVEGILVYLFALSALFFVGRRRPRAAMA